MSTYSVEELTEMSAKLNRALAEAKDKAEQEKAAKTPISAPKKNHTSARALEEESNKSSPSSVIAKTPQATDAPRRQPQVGRVTDPAALLQRAGRRQVHR